MMFCPKCGNEVQEGSAFCGKCGAPIEGTQQVAAAQPSAGSAVKAASARGIPKAAVVAGVAVVVAAAVIALLVNILGSGGGGSMVNGPYQIERGGYSMGIVIGEDGEVAFNNGEDSFSGTYELASSVDGNLVFQAQNLKRADGIAASIEDVASAFGGNWGDAALEAIYFSVPEGYADGVVDGVWGVVCQAKRPDGSLLVEGNLASISADGTGEFGWVYSDKGAVEVLGSFVADRTSPVEWRKTGPSSYGISVTGGDTMSFSLPTEMKAADPREETQDDGGPLESKNGLDDYTWNELSQISDEIAAAGSEEAAIEVAKKYNLCTPDGKLDGTQVKSVTLTDGTQTYVQIVGFAHDDKTGGGKAGITFIFGECIAESPMNAENTNAGGWEASRMREYLNSDGLGLLPDKLVDVIVPVDKLTNNVGVTDSTSSVTVTSDRLWLFSLIELSKQYDGRDEAKCAALSAEGYQYKLFNDMAVEADSTSGPILSKSFEGTEDYWWLRSPIPVLPDGFEDVAPFFALGVGGVGAGTAIGVVPGFCI